MDLLSCLEKMKYALSGLGKFALLIWSMDLLICLGSFDGMKTHFISKVEGDVWKNGVNCQKMTTLVSRK
ncbi:unnamed protein product [Trifolium pratense]|uniref:Uncharacterized protein n=1 Tax=Trifolium pratense TaxID=57577 RepID=A0ACB0JJ31_TRIPR|nr:unnamed protein product [Trifolium pratense]